MSLSDYLLGTLGIYGLPVLFGALLIGCIGVPMPASLLLLAAGSFVEQGEMSLWPVLLLAVVGAVVGDNIGYALGRWGGRRVSGPLGRLLGGAERLRAAEQWLKRREGAAIFFSRWLLTPLGPVLNVTAGLTDYSWPRFLFYDVIGETLWVTLYVLMGKFFSDRVQEIGELLGDFVWMIVGLLLAVVLGWRLLHYFRVPAPAQSKSKTSAHLLDETP
ncbi:MAG TPA: DedA family protein [Pyrinomonadaceae bacterium]